MSEPVEPRRRDRLLARVWKLALLLAVWRSSRTTPSAGRARAHERRTRLAHHRRERTRGVHGRGLLLTTMLLAFGFAALLILDPDTQLLALTLGGALAAFGLALAIAGARLVPQVTASSHARCTTVTRAQPRRSYSGCATASKAVTRRRMLV